MENLLSVLNNFSGIKNIVLYFSPEILLFFGVVLNLLSLLLSGVANVRKISRTITTAVLGLNVIILAGICVRNFLFYGSYAYSLRVDYFEPENRVFVLKLLINLFMLFFVLITSKDIRKYFYKVPILNSIALLLAFGGCMIAKAENYIFIYILLEATSILTYKYGSNMRIQKYHAFSGDYIVLNLIATALFIVSCIIGLHTAKPSQISIIHVCLSIAVLMKIGIFPIYNYLIIKQSKENTPFSILLFCYMSWIGVIAFNKMSNIITPADEIYQISMFLFVVVSLLTFALYASKHKNLIKFFGNFSYFMNGLCILSIIYFQSDFRSIRLSTMFTFALFALYCLINVLKSEFNLEKVYIANLKGIFLNNRLFAFLFSAILIMMTGLIPNGIEKELFEILKNIYIYDKTGFLTVCLIGVLLVIILFNAIKAVQNIYTFDKHAILPAFTKRTTLNYVVPIVVIVFLMLKTIL